MRLFIGRTADLVGVFEPDPCSAPNAAINSIRSPISDLLKSDDERPRLTKPRPSIAGTMRTLLRASKKISLKSSGVSFCPCHVICDATSREHGPHAGVLW